MGKLKDWWTELMESKPRPQDADYVYDADRDEYDEYMTFEEIEPIRYFIQRTSNGRYYVEKYDDNEIGPKYVTVIATNVTKREAEALIKLIKSNEGS